MHLSRKRQILLSCIVILFFTCYNFTSLITLQICKNYNHVKIWGGRSDTEEINSLAQKRPNLPVEFWYSHRQFNLRENDSCALFPDILKVHHIHEHWQILETGQGNVKMFGAYLDDRTKQHTVRILTMINKRSPLNMTTWCQLWFHDRKQPKIVPVGEYFFLWHEYWYQKRDGEYQPYLLSCQYPSDFSYGVPSSVSLVEKYCDNATTSLKINYQKSEKKKSFAVCTRGNNFETDMTVRFVEWIELLVLLGVEKIYTFDIFVNPHIKKLYDYYTAKGYLDVTPLMLPEVEMNDPYLQHIFLEHDANMMTEVVPINHCFLQHMNEYEYIMVTDTDEVIMPKGNRSSFRNLLNKVKNQAKKKKKTPGSYVARNSYFFNNSTLDNVRKTFLVDDFESIELSIRDLEIPEYMHMTQRLFRSTNFSKPGHYVKSIHSTDAVVAVHNHYHLKVLDSKYTNYDFDLEDAYMHHYRNGCQNELKSVCYKNYQTSFVFDNTILQFYDKLKENVIKALDDLGYFE